MENSNNEISYFVDIRIFQKSSLWPVMYYDNSYSTNTLESNLIRNAHNSLLHKNNIIM
jgi:hypothetical protein